MVDIAPSILSADFSKLGEEIEAVDVAGADWIHIDVMDGRFVPNLTVGPLVVAAVRKVCKKPLDVHLMIVKPDALIPEFIEKGADSITVHYEACPHLHRTIQLIKGLKKKAGLALNPATPVSVIESILDDIDLLLIMSVNPGFGGQKFIQHAIEKVRMAKELILKRDSKTKIEVDGGVKVENAQALAEAGVDVFVAGTAIFGQSDYTEAIRALRKAATL